jgi:hypothetical protein
VEKNANVVQLGADVYKGLFKVTKKITSCTNPLQLQINDILSEYFFNN